MPTRMQTLQVALAISVLLTLSTIGEALSAEQAFYSSVGIALSKCGQSVNCQQVIFECRDNAHEEVQKFENCLATLGTQASDATDSVYADNHRKNLLLWGTPGKFDVKGITLGISESEARDMIGSGFHCDVGSQESRKDIDLTIRVCQNKNCKRADQKPRTVDEAKQQLADLMECLERNPDTFAGIPTTLSYWIIDGRVGHISASSMRATQYENVLDAMRSKYGTPQIRTETLTNKMGAVFQNTIATWSSPSGDVIVYNRYGNSLDWSSLDFYSKDAWDQLQKLLTDKQEGAKKDM